ncbi:hypothetical protein N7G274_009645 [Stereocaulon virgatum]|uniref:Uncharacterized protein n=1 Tax=Stereocaulon virgatum TaxID=373712 RepID=A0ABR3ZVS8_9LECA
MLYQSKRPRAWDLVRACARDLVPQISNCVDPGQVYNLSGHSESSASTAGKEAIDCTPSTSILGPGYTAMPDDPTAANMRLFNLEDQWFREYTRAINHVQQSDIAPQILIDGAGGQDTVSPSTMTAQTPVPASLPMAANDSICQPGLTSTLLAQSVTFADASDNRMSVAQRPTTAQTMNSSISQPYAPQPHGSHGPTRTTPGYSRSQPFPIPTYMQQPAYAPGQQSFDSQLPVPGSLQMQQPVHGQLNEPSPREMIQPARFGHRPIYPQFIGPSNGHSQMEYMSSSSPYQASNMMQGLNVNGGQNYPQFNNHMNGQYQMYPTVYGRQPQAFLEPQNHFNMSNQMPEQTYAHQAGEQQQQPPPPQNHFNMPNQISKQTYAHQAGEQQQLLPPQNHFNMSNQMPRQIYPHQAGEQQQLLSPQNHFNIPNQMPRQIYPHQAGEQQQQQQPPQNHFNMSNQMPEQTYPDQAEKQQQQQIAPRQLQQPAQSGLEWIPGMTIDVNAMMMRVLLQHIVDYRTRFKQVLQNEFPTSFAKCIRIRFKADYVINFSMACKLCNSYNITFASETRKYQLTDEMEKRENLKMIVEWGTELWHFCQDCRAQWNVFSPVHCRYWGEYLAVDLGQGPGSNALHHHEPKELLSQNAVHLEKTIQKPVQSTGQPQQPVQESTELQIAGYFTSQEPSRESAQVIMPGLARDQSNGGVNHHGSSSQDTVQGPNKGLNPILPSRLDQCPGPYQEHAEQKAREQAVSRSPAPTRNSLRNGTWRPQSQQWGEEADEHSAERTTQIQGTCRDFGVLNDQKSAAKGPQSKAIGPRRATTQNAAKKSTSHTAPSVEPSDPRPMTRQRELS